MDKKTSPLFNALGFTSLFFSILTLLTLGSFIYLLLGYFAVIDFRPHKGDDAATFLFWFSPLISILAAAVAASARKSGSAVQKKTAQWGFSAGILCIIISFCLSSLAVYWALRYIA